MIKIVATILAFLCSPALAQQGTIAVATSPSGAAGGSLKGTYPNPGLADVNSIATSLAIGGATIGSNALAVTGTSALANTVIGAGSAITSSGPGGALVSTAFTAIGTSGATVPLLSTANTWTLGQTYSAAMTYGGVTLSNAVTGTGNMVLSASPTLTGTAAVAAATFSGVAQITNATDASAASGSGSLQVSGGVSIAKRFWIPAITASSGLQTAVLCQSSGGEMIADSVACLASSGRFKNVFGPMADGAIDKIMRIPIERWSYKSEGILHNADWTRERIGPIAEDVAEIDPRLVGYDAEGRVRSISTEQLLALAIKAIQEQQAEITELKSR